MACPTSIVLRAVPATLAACVGGLCVAATPVTVDLRNVAVELARDVGVQPARLPPVVQLPAAAAARACGIDATALTAAPAGALPRCSATTRSRELADAVRRALVASEARQPRAYEPGSVRGFPTPQQSEGVLVDIAPISGQIALLLGVEQRRVPLRIRVPAAVASQACRIGHDVLAHQRSVGSASCTALTATPALNEIVRPQLTPKPSSAR